MNILKGDRSHLGTFHVQFPFGKTLTVNVFRQRINQLFQGCGDIWRGIAKRSLRAIAFRHYPPVSSQGKILNVLRGDRIALPTGDRIQCSPDSFSREKFEHTEGRSLSSRHISCSVPVRENIDGKRFPSKDKSVISRG
ncbi:hypothetical protein [Cylindrospermopsis raciborskii]|uniref:hypothetical protein n=1 Tax=Cylindrospermopsis raciborskii TaxID=77022 RepID=UPI0015E0CFA5|nr:hypothetical protein [Cylindrospermopsis raciborskii]